MKRVKITELRGIVEKSILNSECTIDMIKDETNPQIIQMKNKCKAELDLLKAFQMALHGDNVQLNIYKGLK